ncbi:hypothetical protein [Spirosoma radiotolerans]|uniref:Histidine kinase n=1 Tax=Spirosoma radiotolerans TaxID=1379870 RepID=A0A0E3V6D1_9BACT|nr:hypothetical protein [Spirosoma radiotolerans]AKD54426.1 hypothetical protein SD10_05375 [Spirosoma radiotolerans]
MSELPEQTRNDLRRIGGELSRLSFEVLTVVGVSDQDAPSQKRLTEVMDSIEQAIQGLAEIITYDPSDNDDDFQDDE